MPWQKYPFESWMREMDDMRREMENLFRQVQTGGRLVPPGSVADRMLPVLRGEFRVDVRELDEEIIVAADLPGIEKESVSLHLANPRALEISSERKAGDEEKNEDFYMRERITGSMRRIVDLPAEVTDTDAKASFTNGVLEVRLKKTRILPGKSSIPIE